MNRTSRLALLVAMGVLVVTACSDSSPHRDGARTYYESLDLSSPTVAVETVADAFARDDFMAVWLSFGRHAQTRATRHISPRRH